MQHRLKFLPLETCPNCVGSSWNSSSETPERQLQSWTAMFTTKQFRRPSLHETISHLCHEKTRLARFLRYAYARLYDQLKYQFLVKTSIFSWYAKYQSRPQSSCLLRIRALGNSDTKCVFIGFRKEQWQASLIGAFMLARAESRRQLLAIRTLRRMFFYIEVMPRYKIRGSGQLPFLLIRHLWIRSIYIKQLWGRLKVKGDSANPRPLDCTKHWPSKHSGSWSLPSSRNIPYEVTTLWKTHKINIFGLRIYWESGWLSGYLSGLPPLRAGLQFWPRPACGLSFTRS